MRTLFTFLMLTFVFTAWSQSGNNAVWPMKMPIQLTSNFAEYRKNHFHSGIDLSVRNKADLSVFSIWEGYVSRVRYNAASYGRAVYITHPNGYSSVYGHLDSFAPFIDSLVTKYQYENQVFETDMLIPAGTVSVKKGEVLGIAGNSGYSFGAHLHFEIRDAATDDPVNPLKFIPIDDFMEPVFYQLAVYCLQPGGYLPAKSSYYKAVKKGNLYTTATEIMVPDTFFLGFDVQDYQTLSYYRLLPQKIEVLFDDSLVWKMEFDQFSFDQSGACRGVFDHKAGLSSNKQIVTTYTGNHQRQKFFKVYSNDGIFTLPDTNRHKLTVKATDTEFNTSTFNTTLKRSFFSLPPINKNNVIHNCYFHEFTTENLSVICDTGTFYGDIAPEKPLLTEHGSGKDLYWEIGYAEIPIIKPIHVYFLSTAMLDEKTLLAQVDKFNIQKVWKPMADDHGKLTVNVDRPGVYKLFRDTIPPVIGKTNIPASGKPTWQKEFTFVVTDNSGSIKMFNAYINNAWTLMTYDLKSDTFAIPLTAEEKATIKNLRVEFIDLSGNKREKEFSF